MNARLNAPVTTRLVQPPRLQAHQTVGEALAAIRATAPPGRIIYFYVVDEAGTLRGVVPTRALLLSSPDVPVADVMVTRLVTIPSGATVLDACEFFVLHRLLAVPVVDDAGRLLGVVDVDLYAEELRQLDRATLAGRLLAPLARFLRIEAAGGVVLLLLTVIALALANSPLADAYTTFWKEPLGLTIGSFSLVKDLKHWIDDGLMTLFFFVVGLEIKRELVTGELADPRKALLPVVAALGGMVMPAVVYLLCLAGREGTHGWAVPMATDIAFVVGALTLLGPRVPAGLKVLLLTLAIADDIGAILVIAVVFPSNLSLPALGLAGGGLLGVIALRWIGVRQVALYALVGAAIWLAFLKSGVHPTVAGVLLGLLTPTRPQARRKRSVDVVHELYARLRGHAGAPAEASDVPSPLEQLETALHPWVAFVIMPLFALANAGVVIQASAALTPVAFAVALGLLLGKPIGIVAFSWASVRLGLTRLPAGVNWPILAGAGCLGGIGFTMALFMAQLAFKTSPAMLAQSKIGILGGSLLSGLVGCAMLLAVLPKTTAAEPENGSAER